MPTSWNVTPHRYEHGKPVMTGDKWKVLDLNDECVVNECEVIVENLGATWIRARLDFYGRWLDQLFGPSGQLLQKTPTRKALMAAETLMAMLLHEFDEMQTSSVDYERAMADYSQRFPRFAPS